MHLKSIVLLLSPLLFTLSSPTALAQGLNPGPQQQPQPTPGTSPGTETPINSQLKLSPQQEAQIEHIKAVTRAQIRQILTPQQWEQLQALRAAGQRSPSLSSLDLSSKQKSDLKQVERLANQRLLSIFTPEQRQTLATLSQNAEASSLPTPARSQSIDPQQLRTLTTPIDPRTLARLEQLSLTPQQQTQIVNVQLSAQADVSRILTPDQQLQLQASKVAGDGAIESPTVALSSQQQSQLQQVQQVSQERLLAVLTPTQQEQLSALEQADRTQTSVPGPDVGGLSEPTPPAATTSDLSLALGTQQTQTLPPAILSQLNLTTDQASQIQAIKTLAQAQMRGILTPEQWNQLQASSAATAPGSTLPALNLSLTQQSELAAVTRLVNQRLQSILTPAQQQKLRELSQTPQP